MFVNEFYHFEYAWLYEIYVVFSVFIWFRLDRTHLFYINFDRSS